MSNFLAPANITKFLSLITIKLALFNYSHVSDPDNEKRERSISNLFETNKSIDKSISILAKNLVEDTRFKSLCNQYYITRKDENGTGYDEDRLDEVSNIIIERFIEITGLGGIYTLDGDEFHEFETEIREFFIKFFNKNQEFEIDNNDIPETDGLTKLISEFIVKLASDTTLDHRDYMVHENESSSLYDMVNESGSIDNSLSSFTEELLENSEFNELREKYLSDDEDEDETSEELFNHIISHFGLFEIFSLHADNVYEFKEKINEFFRNSQ